MEQLLKRHEIRSWQAELLLQRLLKALPESRGDDPEAIRKAVQASVTAGGGLSGEQLIDMMIDLNKPGSLSLAQHPTFQRVFGEDLSAFSKAMHGIRAPASFLETIFNGIVLESCHLVVKDAENMIFKVIGQDNRAREFDAFYPSDESWCIAGGMQEQVTYKTGRSGVHGCALAPAGWLRLALKVDDEAQRRGIQGDEWKGWQKAYHGTAGQNLRSIVDAGLLFGDGRHGKAGAGGKQVIYCSPSLEYSAHWVYTSDSAKMGLAAGEGEAAAAAPPAGSSASGSGSSTAVGWSDLLNGVVERGGVFAQFVFEVRVRPGKYKVQGNTLASSLWPSRALQFDKTTLSDNLEWIVGEKEDLLCTGVMVRQLNVNPKDFNKQRIEVMKEHVGWDEEAKVAKRNRDYGGVPAGRKVYWAYNEHQTRTVAYADEMPWKRYSDELSKTIEDAYQSYQRFAFLGRPEGAPGPYIIDFGNECEAALELQPEQRRADADKEQGWRRRAVRRFPA